MSTILRQFEAQDKEFHAVEKHIVEEERPPMISIDKYKEQQKSANR
jgi:hypothetical protein